MNMSESKLSESTLKKLVTVILNEIKFTQPEGEGQSILSSFFKSAQDAREKHPSFSVPKTGYSTAHTFVRYIHGLIRKIITDDLHSRTSDLEMDTMKFDQIRETLVRLMHHWATKFWTATEDRNTRYELVNGIQDLMSHFKALDSQIEQIHSNIKNKNLAVAQSQIEHLQEIINNISVEVDGIFSVGNLKK